MHNKLSWPISPCINPLYISMHFTPEDMLLIEDDFLKGLGGEDLKRHAPVGTRDIATKKLLEKNEIPSYFSGCLTLTLKRKFKQETETPYICLTDISEDAVTFVQKNYPDLEIKLVEHVPDKLPPLVDHNADWNTRFHNVEKLLSIYQNASAVVTSRIHCAMPCLALGTPVLLLNDDSLFDHGRLDGLSELAHSATTAEFITGKANFNLYDPPENPKDYLQYREQLINTVQQFIEANQVCTPELKMRYQAYDGQWEERAIWKNKLLADLPQKHVKKYIEDHAAFEEMEKGRQWLMEQNRGLEQQNTALTQQVSELTDWIRQLEQQCAELKGWSDQLTEGTQWLERQNTGLTQQNGQLQEENQELEQQNIELKSWADQLTEAKLWLEGQWKAEKQAHAQTQDALVHAHEQLKDQENAIARQRNMLNLLLNDKWIQKIIRMRKIPVQE